jgi:cytosine deaminase
MLSILALVVVARNAAYPQALMALTERRTLTCFDLLVRNATLPDGRKASTSASRAARSSPSSRRSTPATPHRRRWTPRPAGQPPFVDAHFHMDATLSYGLPRINARHAARRHRAVGRAEAAADAGGGHRAGARLLRLGGGQGLLAIRSHVDVCDDRLLAVEALLEVKRRVAPYLDLQLVAFPQDGVCALPARASKTLKRALGMGVDVVGGIPHFERTMADGRAR